jgi:hypothetical protein
MKDDHATEVHQALLTEHEIDGVELLSWTLGAASAFSHQATNATTNLVRGLARVRDEKLYLAKSYKSFEQMLNEDPRSPMNYKRFNRIENQFKEEGAEAFETFNRLGIPDTVRKLLAESNLGEIVVDGEVLKIGEQEIGTADSRVARQAIVALASQLRDEQTRAEKASSKVEKLEGELTAGREQFEELQRSLESEAHPVDRTLMRVVGHCHGLRQEIEDLSPEERKARGESILDQLWNQITLIREALGYKDYAFNVSVNVPKAESRASKLFDKDADWGDEAEGNDD